MKLSNLQKSICKILFLLLQMKYDLFFIKLALTKVFYNRKGVQHESL
jgi:hypothetical protein